MPSQPGRVVTPEAVVLHVRHAGPGTRVAARALDSLIQVGLLLVVLIAVAVAGQGGGGSTALAVIAALASFLVVFGYPAIMEATWRGRTLGKAALGLRVVTTQGAPITFRHAAIRSALFVVDGLLIGPAIGLISLLLTTDTVRLGDLAGGTIVLREGSGATLPSVVTFDVPPGAESYVGHLDVGGLRAEDYALVRGFLTRSPDLGPDHRSRLALDIATRTAGRLHLPPQPMAPEAFLWCVAAAVQHRGVAPVGATVPGPAGPSGWGVPAAGPAPPPAAPQPPSPAPRPGDRPGFAPPS